MINPRNERHLLRLRGAMEACERDLRHFRERRRKIVELELAQNYGDEATPEPMPVNYLHHVRKVWTRHLVSNFPRVDVGTDFTDRKATAASLESVADQLIREVSLRTTLQACVYDALTCVGIRKCGIERVFTTEARGYEHDVAQPFLDWVDLDNYVVDMSATRRDQIAFEGDYYWVPLEEAKATEYFDETAREKLQASQRTPYGRDGEPLTARLGHEQSFDGEDLEPMVCLVDVWLPRPNLIVTMPKDQEDLLLASVEWDGPEAGPYDTLGFSRVPGQLLPLAPLQTLRDLCELLDAVMRKISQQAERQKKIGVGQRGNDEDNRLLKEAQDGDLIGLGSPQAVPKELSVGGVDQINGYVFLMVKSLLDELGGNVPLLAGAGAQSETASQDLMLRQDASETLNEMAQHVHVFTERCIRDLLFWEWTNPLSTRTVRKTLPGTDLEVVSRFGPDERLGDFLDYNFRIVPYSMRRTSPAQKLRQMLELVTNLTPHMELMREQGLTFNYRKLIEAWAEYADVPELKDIIENTGEPFEEPPQAGQRPKQAPHTVRETVRRNVPQTTRRGQSQVLQQLFAGGNPQGAEMAGLFRTAT